MADVESIIKTAAIKAAYLNDNGDDIKGILLHEDVFYELMKKEPKFKGIIGATTSKGRKEFYVRPLTENDLKNLQIVQMGSYIFTNRDRENQEDYLANLNKK